MIKKVFIGIAVVVLIVLVTGYYFLSAGESSSKESVQTKQVTTCMSYLVGANANMDCVGDYTGRITMVELYRKGWTYKGDISGTNKLMLVFEK